MYLDNEQGDLIDKVHHFVRQHLEVISRILNLGFDVRDDEVDVAGG